MHVSQEKVVLKIRKCVRKRAAIVKQLRDSLSYILENAAGRSFVYCNDNCGEIYLPRVEMNA